MNHALVLWKTDKNWFVSSCIVGYNLGVYSLKTNYSFKLFGESFAVLFVSKNCQKCYVIWAFRGFSVAGGLSGHLSLSTTLGHSRPTMAFFTHRFLWGGDSSLWEVVSFIFNTVAQLEVCHCHPRNNWCKQVTPSAEQLSCPSSRHTGYCMFCFQQSWCGFFCFPHHAGAGELNNN